MNFKGLASVQQYLFQAKLACNTVLCADGINFHNSEKNNNILEKLISNELKKWTIILGYSYLHRLELLRQSQEKDGNSGH